MKTISISLADTAADETVEAEYFQIEDGWVTFKTEAHKAVAAYPEARVMRIRTSDLEDQRAEVLAGAAGSLRDWYEERMIEQHATDVDLSEYEQGREVGTTEGILAASLKIGAR